MGPYPHQSSEEFAVVMVLTQRRYAAEHQPKDEPAEPGWATDPIHDEPAKPDGGDEQGGEPTPGAEDE
jgi:hypothetical protein